MLPGRELGVFWAESASAASGIVRLRVCRPVLSGLLPNPLSFMLARTNIPAKHANQTPSWSSWWGDSRQKHAAIERPSLAASTQQSEHEHVVACATRLYVTPPASLGGLAGGGAFLSAAAPPGTSYCPMSNTIASSRSYVRLRLHVPRNHAAASTENNMACWLLQNAEGSYAITMHHVQHHAGQAYCGIAQHAHR
jgi:hypothetical protein